MSEQIFAYEAGMVDDAVAVVLQIDTVGVIELLARLESYYSESAVVVNLQVLLLTDAEVEFCLNAGN